MIRYIMTITTSLLGMGANCKHDGLNLVADNDKGLVSQNDGLSRVDFPVTNKNSVHRPEDYKGGKHVKTWLFEKLRARIMPSYLPYEGMQRENPPIVFSAKFTRIHKYVKCLGQLQVFLGLCCVALGSLSDFAGTESNPTKVPYIVEFIGMYLIITGFIGISGSSSYRRGLMSAFLVMSLHVALICVPAIIATSVKAILDSNKDCYSSCEMNICKVVCGLEKDNVPKGSLTAISSDVRIDIGMLGMAAIELIISLLSAFLCGMGVCESFGMVDPMTISQVHKITTLKTQPKHVPINSVSADIEPLDP